MKKICCLCLSLLLLYSCGVFAHGIDYLPADLPSLPLAAHRGYSAVAPENTLAAFRAAGEAGFYACECDIYPTTDGKWAVLHDATVDRTTDGTGRADCKDFETLSAYRIDHGENIEHYGDEHIPELGEYLAVCNAYGMAPVIEVKGGSDSEIADLAARLRAETDASRVYLVVKKGDRVLELNRLLPEANVFLLTYFTLPGDLDYCVEHGLDGIDFCCPLTPAVTAKAIARRGLRSAVWTVNAALTARYEAYFGVEFVTTNGLATPVHGFLRTVVNTVEIAVGLIFDVFVRS